MYLDSIKNSKVYIEEHVVQNSNFALVLIHGLAEHCGRYKEFITQLNNNAISVFAIDLRGHGKSIGKHGDSESIKKVIYDISLVINYIKRKFTFKKLGIFGHSVGGIVASIFAGQNIDIDFLILSSPAIYLPKKLRFARFIPYKFLPFIKVKKNHSESNEMLEVSKNDLLALHYISIRTIGVYFIEGLSFLKKVLITCPTLLMYGKQDPLLNESDKFYLFFEKIKNTNKQIICYEESKHRIVQNINATQHIEDIIRWIIKLDLQ